MEFILIIAPVVLASILLILLALIIILGGYHKDADGDWTYSGDWARKILWTYVVIGLLAWYFW